MAEKNTVRAPVKSSGLSSYEDSYRLAKLLRSGSRELERQLNTKKTKRLR